MTPASIAKKRQQTTQINARVRETMRATGHSHMVVFVENEVRDEITKLAKERKMRKRDLMISVIRRGVEAEKAADAV
jgi:hypothetical protein